MYCVQYLVYENSLIVHWQSICKVKLVLLQEVKEPVLRRIGGARGVGGANLKKKISFSSFCCDTCVKYSGEKTLWETGHWTQLSYKAIFPIFELELAKSKSK